MIPSAAARIAPRVPAGLARAACAIAAALAVTTGLTLPAADAHPTGGAGGRPAAAQDTGSAPLAVSIASLTPSTVPARGNVTLTGEITNRSDSTWTDLRVYPLASDTPMTTSAELEEATATDETLEVGARLTDPGLYAEVDDLAPGESTGYVVSVPRSELPISGPGVYWLGIHVLGTNEEGRVTGADGRARTFIAAMPSRSPRTTLSLVIPVRGEVRRTSDGRLANVAAWNRRIGEDGRLARLVDLVQASSGVPLTWVVDPAALEAVQSIAKGNPAFDLTPTDTDEEPSGSASPSESPGESPSASASPEDEESASPAPDESEAGGSDAAEPEAEQAALWLSAFGDLVAQQAVLTLPYGDVDVAPVLRGGFGDLFERSNELSETAMTELGLHGAPVVAPSNGMLPNAALEQLGPDSSLLLSEHAVDADSATVRLPQGTEAVLTSDVARVGGPRPTPPFGALALRQRILAEAAVHSLSGKPDQPLVVSTPELWDPGSDWRTSWFFSGLDVPWIRTVDLPLARAIGEPEEYDGRLTYPRSARRRELPDANVLASQELDGAGSVLATLLTRNDTIDEQVGRAALLGSSTNARTRPHKALVRTRRISGEVHSKLGQVHVEGSDLVTMSSESGNFQVTVVNGLDEPVTVGIEADTGTEDLEIRAPDLVSLGPGQRASVRLAVTATGTGVHSVRISPTTQDGRPLGRSTKVKVRSSQVGLVIWLIIGTGAVVFFAAIGARILRRVRSRRQAQDTTKGPATPVSPIAQQEDTAS